MMKHTATPWHVDGPRVYSIEKTLVATIALFRDAKEEKANAAFIVRACNAHDDLVMVLQTVRKYPAMDFIERDKMIDAAIAKATGEQP